MLRQIILWRLLTCLIWLTLLWLVPSHMHVTGFPSFPYEKSKARYRFYVVLQDGFVKTVPIVVDFVANWEVDVSTFQKFRHGVCLKRDFRKKINLLEGVFHILCNALIGSFRPPATICNAFKPLPICHTIRFPPSHIGLFWTILCNFKGSNGSNFLNVVIN